MLMNSEYLTPMMVMQLAKEMGISIKRPTVMRAFHPLPATGERRSLAPKLHATVFPGTRKRVCLKEDAIRWIEYQREKQGGVQDTIGRKRPRKA